MRIAFLTESRADFGGIYPVFQEAKNRGIEGKIINIGEKRTVEENDPYGFDWLVFLGDRPEVLHFVIYTATYIPQIGLAHLSGGDRQDCALVDEPTRDALSMFAHLHFPCTEKSADNLIAIGIDVDRITVAGSTMVDDLRHFKPEIREEWQGKFAVLIHPEPGWRELLHSIITVEGLENCILLQPNSDPGYGDALDFPYVPNMERSEFLQLLWNCKAFVGNSSAMYLEAQYIGTPCFKLGERNNGREEAFPGHISRGMIETIRDARTATGLREGWELGAHGDGTAAQKIIDTLEKIGVPTPELLNRRRITCV